MPEARRVFWGIALVWTLATAVLATHEIVRESHLLVEGREGLTHLAIEWGLHLFLWLVGLLVILYAGRRITTLIEDRRAETRVRMESEERYRTLFETHLAGVYRTRVDGTIVDCNHAFARMLGYSGREALINTSALSLYFEERDRQRFIEQLQRQDSLEGFELRLRKKDGTALWVIENVSLIEKVLLVGSMIDVTSLKRAQDSLKETEERLKTERLRARIAADLHDDIGSTLSSTSIFSAILRQEVREENQRATTLLNRIDANLRDVQQSLHDIVWTINPENDVLQDIKIHMGEYATEIMEARGVTLHLEVPDEQNPVRVPMEVRRDLYLIFKEAINNVVTHSGCTESWVTIFTRGRFLEVTVADNGRGFETTKPGQGNGLLNMDARARAAGGVLEITSRPGKGTTVALRLPIA